MESSKENNPFGEESKEEEMKNKAKKKIDNYRKSIIKMLDNESDGESSIQDGLETNREISDEDRDDDNIMEGSQKINKYKEIEKDLTLESIRDPIRIEGEPYFKKSEKCDLNSRSIILKGVIIDKFGDENNVEKGIEFCKKQGNAIFMENKRKRVISEFREK